jgi:hypothetical protein
MPEGICFGGFLPFFTRGHTLQVSICVFPVLFFFVNFCCFLRVCLSACKQKLTKKNRTGKTKMET